MGNFFKKFGQGILYVLVLPALLIVLVFFSIYGLGLFFVMLIKNIVMFFKGKSFNYKFDEDIEAERRLTYASKPQKKNDEPVVVIANPTNQVMDAEIEEHNELLENREVRSIETSDPVEQHEDRTEEVLEIESKIDDDDDGDGDVDFSPWGGK